MSQRRWEVFVRMRPRLPSDLHHRLSLHMCAYLHTHIETHFYLFLHSFSLFGWVLDSEHCYVAQMVFNSSSCLSPQNSGIIVAVHHRRHRNTFLSCLWCWHLVLEKASKQGLSIASSGQTSSRSEEFKQENGG